MAFDGSTIPTATLGFLPIGGIFTDTFSIGGNDVDIIAVNLVTPNRYGFDVDGAGDAYIRVFDQFGNELVANDDRAAPGESPSREPYIEYNAFYTGLYYVAISPFYLQDYDPFTLENRRTPVNPQPATTGTLRITDLGANVFPDTSSIPAIAPGGLADLSALLADDDGQVRIQLQDGLISTANDVDLARLDLEKGDVLVVDVNIDSSRTLDSIATLFDAAGNRLAFDDDAGTGLESELTYAVGDTGTYYLGISAFSNFNYNPNTGSGSGGSSTGGYSVVLYLNPTIIGTSDGADVLVGTTGEDFAVGLSFDDTLFGNEGDDDLFGGGEDDSVSGGDGQDQVSGEAGNDTVLGGAGRDNVLGGIGNDFVSGDEGNDRVLGALGADTVFGGTGDDIVLGGGDNDFVAGDEGDDRLEGDSGNDTLTGGLDNDTLLGGNQNDSVLGDDGNDSLLGESGVDTLRGGAGTDTVAGGGGNDILFGDAGNDVFDFDSVNRQQTGVDRIADFVVDVDLIDLSTIFDVTGQNVNASNFSLYVQVVQSGANALLRVDANGPGGAGFVQIATVENVSAAALFDPDNFLL